MICCKFLKTCKGFTLIEVIIIIVIAALFGSMLFQFMSAGVTSSSDEVVMVKQGYELIGIMEKMTADYDEATSLDTFRTEIEINYGTYLSTIPGYIQFNSEGNEEPDSLEPYDLLKVTITKDSQSLIALFSG